MNIPNSLRGKRASDELPPKSGCWVPLERAGNGKGIHNGSASYYCKCEFCGAVKIWSKCDLTAIRKRDRKTHAGCPAVKQGFGTRRIAQLDEGSLCGTGLTEDPLPDTF